MKFISWSVIGLSALCLAGCGKKDTPTTSPGSSAGSVSKKSESASAAVPGATQLSKETVGQTIDYTNNVIDFLNSGGEAMNRLERTTSSLAENVKEADDKKDFSWIRPTTIVDIGSTFSSQITAKLAKFPANIGAADRAVFADNTKIMMDAIETIRTDLKTVDKYLNNQDNKDDKDGVKIKALLNNIGQKTQAFYAAREKLGAKIHEISDEAEVIALEGHPLREHILAMKGDMKAAREFLQLMTSKEMATNDPSSSDPVKGNFPPIAVQAKAAYAKLETLKKEHAAINPAALEKAGETAHYKAFYDRMEDFIGSARKNIRFGEEKTYLLEDFIQELDRERQNMISAYNSFAG